MLDDPLIGVPALEDAIDKHPLVVAPSTTLTEVVNLMSQTRGNSCTLPDLESVNAPSWLHSARCSCVLVIDAGELLGIFTERDIVKLTANDTDFNRLTIAEVMAAPVITLSETAFHDVFAALFLFRRYRIRHLVIINEKKSVVGIVSPESIRQVLRPTNLLKMRRVSEVMTTQVIHAPPITSVLTLARMMAKHRVSCIVITQTDSWNDALYAFKPVGIVTERDIVQFKALGLNLPGIDAKTVMSTPLFLLSPENSLWSAHQEMQRRRVQRLVVSWDWGAKLGIVTQTSLLRIFDPLEMYGVVETLQRTVAQLEAEKAEYLSYSSNPLGNAGQFFRGTLEPQLRAENLDAIITRTESHLQYLINNPNLSPELRLVYLNLGIDEIKKIRHQLSS